MQITRIALASITALLLVATGCSRHIAGTAQPDPQPPPVEVSEDGYGIVAGFADAPVQVEIFTEPQCKHCADLQADFGDAISSYIDLGQLTVTYRPLTFLDNEPDGHSARVSNAFFLAADPGASATAFQRFVQLAYAQQESFGRRPSDAALAGLAREAGLPADVVDRIEAGDPALDIEEMDDLNFGFLFTSDPLNAGTPTVYDSATGEVLDIYDDNWLSKLMSSA